MKTSNHSEELKLELNNRLNRIEGQIRGVSKMISNCIYCDDVLNQITSIQSALNGVSKLLLNAHIKSCVKNRLSKGDDKVIDEIIETIGKMLKR